MAGIATPTPGERAGSVLSLAGGALGPLARAQYAALATLRWRMFSNGLRFKRGALELSARVFSFMVYGMIGVALGSGAGLATYFLIAGDEWRFLPILFWVLAFIWQTVPVMLASFQEQFDLGILLRFPVRFTSYVLLYLVFGLVDVSSILGALCCTGILFGVAAARLSLLPWTGLALAIFAAFNILLARAIFAWIERWLAQRRTREILGAVFMVALISVQLVNPAIYRMNHSTRGDPAEQMREARAKYSPLLHKANALQRWLPPGLVAQALRQAAQNQPVAALESLGLIGLYALLSGFILATRLKAEYRGESLSVAPRRDGSKRARADAAGLDRSPVPRSSLHGGESIYGVAGPMAAVVEKEVRALLRTLPLLYAIGAPLILVLVFSTVFLKGGAAQAGTFRLSLPLCLVYAQLGFTQIFYNNLGAEGPGIQLYFLSPTPIRTVILAKNLLHAALFCLVALAAGLLSSLRLGMPDGAVVGATAAWLLFSLPANMAAGNIFSIKMAYRVNPGRISRQRGSQANGLFSLLVQVGVLAVAAAVFASTWYVHKIWIATPIFLAFSVCAILVWLRGLDQVGPMANSRRDKLIATLMKGS